MTQPRIAAVGGNAAFVPLVARVLGSSPDDLTVITSVASAERAIAEGDRVFDVVVLGPTVAEKDAASLAEFVSKEVPTTAVIVVRDAPVDGAFSRLVRSGARDVVDISGGGTELREALMRAVDWTEGIKGKTARPEGPNVTLHASGLEKAARFAVSPDLMFVVVDMALADALMVKPTGKTVLLTLPGGNVATGRLATLDWLELSGPDGAKAGAHAVDVAVANLSDAFQPAEQGLLGQSFLSRFEVQLADSYVELRSRGRK